MACEQPQPDVHRVTVESAFGDFYGKCSCRRDALSLPFADRRDADGWRCPFDAAAVESLRNYQMFINRLTWLAEGWESAPGMGRGVAVRW